MMPRGNSLPLTMLKDTNPAFLIWGIILRVVWMASQFGVRSLRTGQSARTLLIQA